MTETLRSAESPFGPLDHILSNMARVGSVLRDQPYDPDKVLNAIEVGELGKVAWRQDEAAGELLVRIFENDGAGQALQTEINCQFRRANGEYVLVDRPGAFVITSLRAHEGRLVQQYFAIDRERDGTFTVSGSEGDTSRSLTAAEAEHCARLTDDFLAALQQRG